MCLKVAASQLQEELKGLCSTSTCKHPSVEKPLGLVAYRSQHKLGCFMSELFLLFIYLFLRNLKKINFVSLFLKLQVELKSKCQKSKLMSVLVFVFLQFYGYLSQQQNMMQDYVRTGTYQRAILQNHTDFKDKVAS